jgi:hypothetical protein
MLGALLMIRKLWSFFLLLSILERSHRYSYRTPLCLLYPPKIIATACYVLAQRIADGPHSASLDARISYSAPSSSLPTPPSHKPASPDASRFAIEFFSFTEPDLNSVAGIS